MASGSFVSLSESVKLKLRREGVEHQPGQSLAHEKPPMTFEEFPKFSLIERTNVTSLRTNHHVMLKRKAHIAMYQEAKVPLSEAAEANKDLTDVKWTLKLGPLDSEKAIAAAGVAALHATPSTSNTSSPSQPSLKPPLPMAA